MKEYESALKINKLIKESEIYQNLKQKEQAMIEDKDTFILLMDYQNKQAEYNDALKYEKYGSDPKKVQKELSNIKYKVDTNQLVKQYNEAYKKMREFLENITKTILEGVTE
ncbi:MAG: YlbF family regulator [Erysipelotrichaceae bacterium]|nr:YlbF family regulator [Erysipelotrichaceae bacterium]